MWLSADTSEFDEVEESRVVPPGNHQMPLPAQSPVTVSEGHDAGLQVKDGDEIAGETMKGFPDFGKGLLKYWNFRDGCECEL